MGDRRLVTVDSHECLSWQKQHSMIVDISISVPFKKPCITDWNIKFCSQTKTVLEILQSWLQVTSINYSTRILEREGPKRAQNTM